MTGPHERIGRGLETLTGLPADSWQLQHASGGHMLYHKHIAHHPSGMRLFIKTFDPELFTITSYADSTLAYLEKEAQVFSLLRKHKYPHIPSFSSYHDHMLVLSMHHNDEGWYWRLPPKKLRRRYLQDVMEMLERLGRITVPYISDNGLFSARLLHDEGWPKLADPAIRNKVHAKLQRHQRNFRPHVMDGVDWLNQLFADTQRLKALYNLKYHQHPKAVFSHLDARLSNIAWHPEHGAVLVDWSWAAFAPPKSDSTMLLIDLHKAGHITTKTMRKKLNREHAMTMIGYWLSRSIEPTTARNRTLRFHQLASAASAASLIAQTDSAS